MAYREPKISVDFARDFCEKLTNSYETFLPICEREDVRFGYLDKHFRINTKVKAILAHYGYVIWNDLYEVSVQELLKSNSFDLSSLQDLVEYAHHISLLKNNDSVSDEKLKNILNPNLSNSDLIALESQIQSVKDFLNNPVHSWSELEQKIFCRRFFANEQIHNLAKQIGLAGNEVNSLYARLLDEFRSLQFLGDLMELLQNEKYKVISRWRIIRDYPELDIRPFNKFPNYRTLDLIVTLMQISESGESILDMTKGAVERNILEELKGKLNLLENHLESTPIFNLIDPTVVEEYLERIGFKTNHMYRVCGSMEQRDVIIQYLKLRGRPATSNEIRADLQGLLDNKSMNQKIIDTHGAVIPITRKEYALSEWGFEPFLGAGGIISEYIMENGPTHIEMIYAILDGYGFSEKRIKEISSAPPFALMDDVCYLMADE